MKHIFSLYPGGAAGAGLLMLRLHVMLLLIGLALVQLPPLALGMSVLIAAVALGLYARVASVLSMAAMSIPLLAGTHLAPLSIASQVCSLVALALLGPGSLSIDARRFGRKVIRL